MKQPGDSYSTHGDALIGRWLDEQRQGEVNAMADDSPLRKRQPHQENSWWLVERVENHGAQA